MPLEALCDSSLRQAVVLASALFYWTGVSVQAWRVRKRIGRSPNLKPRTFKEKLLWIGWFLVVAVWAGQPVFLAQGPGAPGPVTTTLLNASSLAFGIALIVFGCAATLWCYSIMGNAWRIGIDQKEKNPLVTEGPYRLVRHPIYLFQIVILLGVLLLLPTALSLLTLAVHFVCVSVKAQDEESYLLRIHGERVPRLCLPHRKVVSEVLARRGGLERLVSLVTGVMDCASLHGILRINPAPHWGVRKHGKLPKIDNGHNLEMCFEGFYLILTPARCR